MSNLEVWSSVEVLARAWAETEVIKVVSPQLPDNAPHPWKELPKTLQNVDASFAGLLSNPLRMASSLPRADGIMLGLMAGVAERHASWLDAINKAEWAHRQTIAWLRARLPGYPLLPAPQLVKGSALTTNEFTRRLVWQPQERSEQLHMKDVSPRIAEVLGADASLARALNNGARRVAVALGGSPEWSTLADASGALDDASRGELRACCVRLKERLSPASVDEHEPRLALPRNEYRENVVREEIGSLAGGARVYADAFADANALVEHAASDVFAQLACYPIRTRVAQEIEVVPGSPGYVRFTTPPVALTLPRLEEIVWLDDPVVLDAVQINYVEFTFGAATGDLISLEGTILSGTGDLWRSSAS